jgi:hypothetical protein
MCNYTGRLDTVDGLHAMYIRYGFHGALVSAKNCETLVTRYTPWSSNQFVDFRSIKNATEDNFVLHYSINKNNLKL